MAKIHWMSPTTIVAGMVLGMLFITGHDHYYQSLNGQHASAGDIHFVGSQYTSQQFNIAVGITLATLVHSCFRLSAAGAFYQIFWYRVQRQPQDPSNCTLKLMNIVYSWPGDIVSFLTPSAWLRNPGLFVVALIIW